ncbi:MAG: lipopolysaccharide biosynthesis protein [Prevotellaceae bacterium]|nr:lipopolysaccharide biosynthesis protein [Candidatus Colivivens equi]
MSGNQSNNKRIAKNSIFLYIRTMIIMVVTLFTSRIILQSLGVDDYGIYNEVGGIVSMFSLILGSMTDATQRFLTIELGKGERGDINNVFSTSIQLHIIIGIIIVLIAEPVGLWFMYNKLNIPVERLSAAFWVFQCSLLSFFVLVISIPYNALIVAYERMKAFAYISVIDALLRLIIAYMMAINFSIDKLVLYAILMMITQLLIRNIYNFYCKRNFKESKYHYTKNHKLTRNFGRFAAWSMLGNMSYVCNNYGISLLLGMFFAPFVNAAHGITLQVQGAFSTFEKNFQTAVNPQITKNYAAGDIIEMETLIFRSARLSFLLILIPLIPILFEAETIFKLWLNIVPEYTVIFVQLMVITSLISTLRNPLEVAIKATGEIKMFEISVYGSKLLILPCAYICLRLGCSPTSVFIVSLLFELLAISLSLIEAKRLLGLSILTFIKKTVLRLCVTVLLSVITPIAICLLLNPDILRFLILTLCSIVVTTIISSFVGLTTRERKAIITYIMAKNRT